MIALLRDLKANPLIAFQWIPSHIGIEGNETADRLAKRGLSGAKKAMFLSDSKTKIKFAMRSLTEKVFKEKRLGKMGEDFQIIKKDKWWKLTRSQQVIITRLRTGHFPIRPYLNRYKPHNTNLCRLCNRDIEDIQHITFKCLFLKQQRICLLPKVIETY